MTLKEYLAGLKGKTVAVIGIGVSNTPLIKMLLRTGIRVTACDKNRREDFGGLAEELERSGSGCDLPHTRVAPRCSRTFVGPGKGQHDHL